MYFGVGSVEALLDWFHDAATTEKMLCLFVPGGPEDDELLGQLFDARGSLSPRLGRDVALCLFSAKATLDDLRTRNPESSDFLIVPGLVDVRRLTFNLREPWRRRGAWTAVPADVVPARVRDEALLRTQSAGHEIADHFNLPRRSLPALIFVAAGEAEQFVVPVGGAGRLGVLTALLDDLADVVKDLERDGTLYLPQLIARKKQAVAELERESAWLAEEDADATRKLDSAAREAGRFGLEATVRAVGVERSGDLYRYLGLHRKGKGVMPIPVETAEAARAAVLDPEAHRSLRQAVNAGKARRRAELAVQSTEREIRKLDEALDFETIPSRLRTVEDVIEQLCSRYEGKFRRRGRYAALRRFIRILTGAGRVVESVTSSLASTADNLAQHLGDI